MASNFKISTAARDAACDALVNRIDGGTGAGKTEIREGTIPTNVSDASGGTLLGTCTFQDPSFGASSSGVATAETPIGSDTDADASGDAEFFRCFQGAAG
ncbi:unnamed protein product, partial [marine sediment metagenome]